MLIPVSQLIICILKRKKQPVYYGYYYAVLYLIYCFSNNKCPLEPPGQFKGRPILSHRLYDFPADFLLLATTTGVNIRQFPGPASKLPFFTGMGTGVNFGFLFPASFSAGRGL
jgi:hypothetical protein